MTAIPNRRLTPAEYLAIERSAASKSEYFNGEILAMAGASPVHNRIKENLVGELFARLKGGPCQSFSSDQRVMVDRTGLYTYPDVVIVCGPLQFDSLDTDTLTNPTAIIEVLSPSTERYDRGTKFQHYKQIQSLKEYLLVASEGPVCDRLVRQQDESWSLVSFVGLDATLAFASIPAEIPMRDAYAGVVFPEETLR